MAIQATGSSQTGSEKESVAKMVVASLDAGSIISFSKSEGKARKYIGASGISNPCGAYHHLTLRGFPNDPPDPQLTRIFDQGHRIEAMVVEELRAAGHLVKDVDPCTGKQWEFSSHDGHHIAHLDGLIKLFGVGEQMILEIKSMNRKAFDRISKVGVQLSKPEYYDQCVDGMGLFKKRYGTDIKCLLVVYCKDNSQYYSEVIYPNEERSIEIAAKVTAIIFGANKERIGSHNKEYQCGQCFKRSSCWQPDVAERHCSHCRHSSPAKDRQWYCSIKETVVDEVCSEFMLFKPSARKVTP